MNLMIMTKEKRQDIECVVINNINFLRYLKNNKYINLLRYLKTINI